MAGYRDGAPYILPPRMAFDTSAVHVDIPLPDFSYYGHEYEGLAGFGHLTKPSHVHDLRLSRPSNGGKFNVSACMCLGCSVSVPSIARRECNQILWGAFVPSLCLTGSRVQAQSSKNPTKP